MTDSPSLIFEWWWVLWMLPLPWLYRLLRKAIPQSSQALTVPVYEQLLAGQSGNTSAAQHNPTAYLLVVLMWLGCLLAAAQPVWVGEEVELPASGRDLLLAVDISGSMETADMPWGRDLVRRIRAVKAVVGQFIKRRSGDRVGLILFGGKPYLQSPLTFDRQTLFTLLQEAEIGMAGKATAIGSAIGLGIKQLESRPENHRVMILLTDGADSRLPGTINPLQAADAAAQFNVKVYTVGVGSSRGFGGLFSLGRGSELDEDTLQTIADKTGGRYFRAEDVQQLNDIYLELDKLEPIEQTAETLKPTKALFHWPLAAALLAALLLLVRRAIRGEAYG